MARVPDLWTAKLEDLKQLEGVGNVTARKIVAYLEALELKTLPGLVAASTLKEEAWANFFDLGLVKAELTEDDANYLASCRPKGKPKEPNEEMLQQMLQQMKTLTDQNRKLMEKMETRDEQLKTFFHESTSLTQRFQQSFFGNASGTTGATADIKKEQIIAQKEQDVPDLHKRVGELTDARNERFQNLLGTPPQDNNVEANVQRSRTRQRGRRLPQIPQTLPTGRNAHNTPQSVNAIPFDLEDSEEELEYEPRGRSPPPPKLEFFKGLPDTWNSFIYQFEETIRGRRWSNAKKLSYLRLCLRGKAVEFIRTRPQHVQGDYHLFKSALKERYGQEETPLGVRRKLMFMSQEENESVDDFGDRVLGLASKGYPFADPDVVETMAVDLFLRGCKDKQAAVFASEKSPQNLHDAVQAIQISIQNQKLLGKHGFGTRQVTFQDEELAIASSSEISVRQLQNRHAGSPIPEKETHQLAKELGEIISSNIDKIIQTMKKSTDQSPERPKDQCYKCGGRGHFARDCRTRSPSPRRDMTCYKCNKPGHIARDCLSKSPTREAKCQICEKTGHTAKDCWSVKRSGSPVKSTVSFSEGKDSLNV